MARQVTTLRTVYFSCCLLLASYPSLANETALSPQDHAILSNQIPVHHSPDHPPSTMNFNIENEKSKLPIPRNRRDLNSNRNRQFYNKEVNRALRSAFKNNEEILRFLQSQSSKPYNLARSAFFYNILRPLDRRTARYNSNWDGHSVMHFGKRSIPEDELAKQKEADVPVSKRSSPWSDHNVMHFGKRSDEEMELDSSGKLLELQKNGTDSEEDTNQENGQELDYFNQRDIDKKDNDPWHSMMNFGKRDGNPWGDHNTMHFGKRDNDPWHSMMNFGKRDGNPWGDHNTMHFGKRDNDHWHSMMNFGKRDESLWGDHNTMHFGKRDNDPWHSMMNFGKRDGNPWGDHNTMHFGKRDNDHWHSMMNFGKRDYNDPWHSIMSFGKKSENLPEEIQPDEPIYVKPEEHMENVEESIHFPEKISSIHKRSISNERGQNEMVPEKRYDVFNDHSTMHFGKKSDPWDSHSTMHFGKKSDPWDSHNTMHFGKKSDPWNSHNTMHFGKKSDPWDSHNTMHFGKKSDPWDSHNTMHFGKKSDPWDSHNTMHFGKKSDPWESHSTMHFGKKSDPWDSHNTMHFGKKSAPWESHNTMHFGKKSDPWESHNTMHFGKKSDPWDSHSTMHFGKKSDPWDSHNTMHFGKKSDQWESHNTMHFGKRSEIPQQNDIQKHEDSLPQEKNVEKPIQLQSSEANNLNLKKRSAIRNLKNIKLIKDKNYGNQRQLEKNKQNRMKRSLDIENEDIPNKRYNSNKLLDSKFDNHKHSTNKNDNKTTKVSPIVDNPTKQKDKSGDEKSTAIPVSKRSLEATAKIAENYIMNPRINEENLLEEPQTDSVLHFGKRSIEGNEFENSKVMDNHWEKEQVSLTKKSENPWETHNTMHFGKKSDPWDSHNTMHFGKKSDPWDSHNTMHFGKKSDPWDSHNTMHFGKKSDPWDSHNTMHFGKKSDPWDSHNTMHFGKKSDPWDSHNTMHFGKKSDPWDSHNTMHFGKKSDPWDSHNTMHFGKKSDPWDSHNTMHFGKKSDPWESHNTMHFGKKSDPWESHNTMHFGKKSDPWDSHNTMHFGKKSDPWQSHNTMHFGKRSYPWDSHNTMHFGKKSDPWDFHNTMHFGKRSIPWDSHNTMHFGKRSENQSALNIGFLSDVDKENEVYDLLTASPELNYLNDYENSQEIQLKWKSYLSQLLAKLKEGLLTNSDVEPLKEYLISLILTERIFPEQTANNEQLLNILERFPELDSGEGLDEDMLNEILQQLSSEYETDGAVATDTLLDEDSMDMDDEMPQTGPNLPTNYFTNSQQKLPMNRVNKRFWAPFQGPKSIVYPHAWFASQIRRSALPASLGSSRVYEVRMAEKKEDPVNSFMHFGKR